MDIHCIYLNGESQGVPGKNIGSRDDTLKKAITVFDKETESRNGPLPES